MNIRKAFLIPCLLLLTTAGAIAQSQAKSKPAQSATDHNKTVAPHFFRLKFIVKELEGKKIIDSRIYTTEISALPLGAKTSVAFDGDRSIRADARIPFLTRSYSSVGNLKDVHEQFHYVNVGTDIDCIAPKIIGQKLAMLVTAHVYNTTSAKVLKSGGTSQYEEPIHQDNHWSSEVLIPIGQATVLFTSQEPTSTRTMELDVVATPIH